MQARRLTAFALVFALSGCFLRQGQRYESFTIPRPLESEACLVVGVLGGRARWDAENRWVRKTALALRERGVHAETVENSKKNLAMRLIREAFDSDGDGILSAEEARGARLILYGQSFGGAAVVKLARRLERESVPILLTVQIDSVGWGDALIPPNVRRAANLYQRNGWFIKGEPTIRAADPERTRILGNWRYNYRDKEVDISHVAWHKRLFQKAHTKMGHDPDVWVRVEGLLNAELERAGCVGPADL